MVENPFSQEEHESEFRLHLAIKKHYESCFIGAHNPNLKIFHVANESRDAVQGYWNKVLGILPGLPDLMAGWPHKNTGICEIKLPGKPLSSAQNKVISWAHHIGWHTGVARSVRQFHEVALSWGLKAGHQSILEPDQRTEQQKFSDSYSYFKPPPSE